MRGIIYPEFTEQSPPVHHNQKSQGVIDPYFFTVPMVTANAYLQMHKEFAIDNIPLQIRRAGCFQQDGAAPHFVHTVCARLDQSFPNRWICRSGLLA